jgi:hypothetical protein
MNRVSKLTLAGMVGLLAALPAAPLAADDVRGWLYGTIETTAGKTYTGLLRWGGEEAFWDDHFNGSKRDEPATGDLPREYRGKRTKVTVFGLEINGPWDDEWDQRQLIVRFGDLAEIRPRGDDRAELVLKNGEHLRVEGGSNDFGADVGVIDAGAGEVEIPWERIRAIRFAATPASVRPEGQRLRAEVRTSVGDFSGWLAWDGQESTTLDKLDGEDDDHKVSLAMGKIRAIERRSRRSALVELTDGSKVKLSGTNDVDDSIRGILVEDARFGRVEIPWEVFERAEIQASSDSGKGYDEYPAQGPIRARVTNVDGQTREGEIAYDLDELQRWELFNGSQDDVEYSIPFTRVKQIRRLSSRRSEVTLDNGAKLELEGETDVDETNGGIAFVGKSGTGSYWAWEEVATVELR